MFYVIQIGSDLLAGSMSCPLNWEDAVNFALNIISENDGRLDERRLEILKGEGYYVDESGDWSVCIVLPDK